jgi:hypothetical protein
VRVLLLLSDEHRMVVEGYVALYTREMKIIEFIHVSGSAKKGDLIRFYGISRASSRYGSHPDGEAEPDQDHKENGILCDTCVSVQSIPDQLFTLRKKEDYG